jgi:hypothetical protein
LFEALDQKFHADCFTCAHDDHQIKVCTALSTRDTSRTPTTLQEGERFHEYEGVVYCSDHLAKKLELACAVCDKLITGAC